MHKKERLTPNRSNPSPLDNGAKKEQTADLLNAMASLVYTNEYNPSISSK